MSWFESAPPAWKLVVGVGVVGVGAIAFAVVYVIWGVLGRWWDGAARLPELQKDLRAAYSRIRELESLHTSSQVENTRLKCELDSVRSGSYRGEDGSPGAWSEKT